MARRSRSDGPGRCVPAASPVVACRALLVVLALLAPLGARAQDALSVFAAASLKPALDEIAAGWDGAVSLSYGGSGTLAQQVAAGAPADVVILAAVDWMDWLDEQGVLGAEAVSVATNRLVLIGAADAAPAGLEAETILARLGEDRLAIGDPASVPAGRYAQEALESLGLWSALETRLLPAPDVRAALAYVEGGDAPLGIVYGSDAVGAAVSVLAEFPEGSHTPIAYPGAVTRDAGPEAQAFLDRVAASADVFAAFGFGR